MMVVEVHTGSTVAICQNTTNQNESSLDKVLTRVEDSKLGV